MHTTKFRLSNNNDKNQFIPESKQLQYSVFTKVLFKYSTGEMTKRLPHLSRLTRCLSASTFTFTPYKDGSRIALTESIDTLFG